MKGDLICKFCGVTPRPKKSGEGMYLLCTKDGGPIVGEQFGRIKTFLGLSSVSCNHVIIGFL